MIDFIRVLRAAGVRISLAESMDAMRAVDALGVEDRAIFRATMQTTLVKEARDQESFGYFFPLFFGESKPPMTDIPDQMSGQQKQMLQQALQSMMGDLGALRDLMKRLLEGRTFSDEQLQQAGDQAGVPQAAEMGQRGWFERRMQRQMDLQQMRALIDQLMAELRELGMDEAALDDLREQMQQNADGLTRQVSQYVGASLAEQMAAQEPQPKPDLLDVPFTRLGDDQIAAIRDEIRRLAARLRSRAALRQRRARQGEIDPRRMMRANMRYDSVPIEMRYRTRHVKPSLVVICDISTSMRYCAEFLLTLIYELQDQVARTHSYVFIGDMVDISTTFADQEPQAAIERVLLDNRPGYYSTDLGAALATFRQDHFSTVTSKTTVIMLGDGRNNFNDPRLDIMQEMGRRARRVIWFNPEPPGQWGTGDSDMHRYALLATAVYKVATLRELAAAVDAILVDG